MLVFRKILRTYLIDDPLHQKLFPIPRCKALFKKGTIADRGVSKTPVNILDGVLYNMS